MKKNDVYFVLGVIIFFLPFFVSDQVYDFYTTANKEHGMILSFIKFALLATLGESIGLRIRNGVYNTKGFGLIPRAIVWGFLGLTIKLAFVVFLTGVPAFMTYMGVENAAAIMKGDFSNTKLLIAFVTSVAINLIYAPVMMTLHKITDTHIVDNGGTVSGLFTSIEFASIFKRIDWDIMWNFVFKKTIPFFWIPAHTITFLLPGEYQVLFAAILGIVLGILLAFAAIKKK